MDICINQSVEHSKKHNGFDKYCFKPRAIIDMDYKDIDCSQMFLSKKFSAPIFVTGMTGGIDRAKVINHIIAKHCADKNIAMGLGSVRVLLENPMLLDHFAVKKKYPKLFLISNLGISQLMSANYLKDFKKAYELVDADAIAIHCNILQELIQCDSIKHRKSIKFKGVWSRVEKCVKSSSVPVIFKEVGCGMDINSVRLLIDCGVSSIDLSGSGGTSWAYIEGLRSKNPVNNHLGEVFRDWGISSADNISDLKDLNHLIDFTVTGGIRDGLSAAKAIALGAKMTGSGLNIFKAAVQESLDPYGKKNNSCSYVSNALDSIIEGIKIVQFATHCKTLDKLCEKIVLIK